MACSDCLKLGVPVHLCAEGKPAQMPFVEDELLYRRHDENIVCELIELDLKIVERIFRLKNDSINRSTLSKLEDVLIDDNGRSYLKYGILSIPVKDLSQEFVYDSNGRKKTVRLVAEHVPLECNYAHAQISCYIDGVLKEDGRPPDSAKVFFRRHFLRCASIAKYKED